MSIGKKIERTRGRAKLADIERKNRPAAREDELAERRHRHELRKLDKAYRDEQADRDRRKRQALRSQKWKRRRAAVAAVFTTLGGFLLGVIAWLSARWLMLRAWIADRIVVVPVLVAGGSALYGQFGYLHDSTVSEFDGDRTGMGWPAPVALLAGLAVEVMAFVLFRAAKRGRDAGDDVRLEAATGWGIVSGAVWFNWTHVDPLAGFLSAIGPIAWEVRERRERRNREISNGTRGKAAIPMPRLGLLFRHHYRDEYRAMLRIALWERARLAYPALVAKVETRTAAAELAESIDRLANLVSVNPVQLALEPGTAPLSSQTEIVAVPGSAEPGTASTPRRTTAPGSSGEPVSPDERTTSSGEPGSAEPGSGTGSTSSASVSFDSIPVQVVPVTAAGSPEITAYPVFTEHQVSAGSATTEPGSEPGSPVKAPAPGTAEPGTATASGSVAEPGSGTAATEPGTDAGMPTAEPGSATQAATALATEPGSPTAGEPGPVEPGRVQSGAVSSNPVQPAETDLEQTRPMPRLVQDGAEPGSPNPVRSLRAVPTEEDAEAVKRMVDLSLELIDREGGWVSREAQIAHLRANGVTVTNRRRDAWWQQMKPYRDLTRGASTG